MQINYSFIIPHKNCPDLLQRCVGSIPERDDVQVIIVDDNSDDGKKPALKEHKNLQVILLDATQSKGAGRARNVGLKHAEGKWLVFADSDDYYMTGFLEVLDKYVDANVEVIYFNNNFVDGDTGNILPMLSIQKRINCYDGSKLMTDKLKYLTKVPWNKMVLHDIVKQHNIRFEEVPNGNDILFSLSVGHYAKNIVVEKTPLYVYCRNTNSILTSSLSVSGALCKLEHRMKLNDLYDSIGYPQWKVSGISIILLYTKKVGIKFLWFVIKNIPNLLYHKSDWTKMIFSQC